MEIVKAVLEHNYYFGYIETPWSWIYEIMLAIYCELDIGMMACIAFLLKSEKGFMSQNAIWFGSSFLGHSCLGLFLNILTYRPPYEHHILMFLARIMLGLINFSMAIFYTCYFFDIASFRQIVSGTNDPLSNNESTCLKIILSYYSTYYGLSIFLPIFQYRRRLVRHDGDNDLEQNDLEQNDLEQNDLEQNDLEQNDLERNQVQMHVQQNIPTTIVEHDQTGPCSICLVDYKQQEKISKLKCYHTFHEPCIRTWIQQNSSCPLCRRSV
ncbi:MAG: E3 ubiquitin-protein ligase RLIM [Dasosvirus sp.]|uniref:E3 ubiquitin-protein ligase RLIM n=1 Tax=Dasosvirus sp. TaxID=2487764 RepID=A0A3G4ZRS7_9VIRU|nr:MAG: E3 ubiquitin-protein ligase RLIM [Dasosvirus sp.]